jgi:hypothetical protein
MPFQMPQINDNIGNALANIGQIRQQRTQNALAERQFGLTENAQRRQQEEFDTEQANAQRKRVIDAHKSLLSALARVPAERRAEAARVIAQQPGISDVLPAGYLEERFSNPDALSDANIAVSLNVFNERTPDQIFEDARREAEARDLGPTYTYRDTEGEIVAFNNRDPGDIRGTGRRPKPPAPAAPPAVIYQQGPQAPSFIDAQGNPVPTVFNPRTGRYEVASVTPGLTPAPRPQPGLTDGQSKALLFGSRMREANTIFDQLGEEGVTTLPLGYRAASETPILGAAVTANATEGTQSLDQAQRDFINAVLRRESGASISPEEFKNAERQYFPQPGEGPRQIEQKRRARLLAEQGILAEVPESRRNSLTPPQTQPPAGRQGTPTSPVRVTTPAEARALPKGTFFVGPDGITRQR